MAKKIFLVLVLACFAAGGVFAQAKKAPASSQYIKNWFSGEVNILGAGVRYERMLTDRISIGANAYWSTLIIWSEIEVGASFRYYAWKDHLYVGSGLGFHMHNGLHKYSYRSSSGNWVDSSDWGWITGVAISPDVGFRIDFGDKGGFFISPGIKFPVTFGAFKPSGLWWWGRDDYEMKSRFGVGFDVVPYIGLGFAFGT